MGEQANLAAKIGNIISIGMGTRRTLPEGKARLKGKVVAFLEITRPILLLFSPALVGSGIVLSIKGVPPTGKTLLFFIAVVLATGGIHSFNDWADRERDLLVWPNRPIPSGRVREKEALILSFLLFSTALAISWNFFNSTNFLIMLVALILGCLYCLHLRDKIGYLTLPPIIGLFPIGGWSVFSPKNLFSSSLPWLLYLLALSWQAGHIMVYSPCHPLRWMKDKPKTEMPALFFSTTPYMASLLGGVFHVLTLLISIWLFFVASLGYIYLVMALLGGFIALSSAVSLVHNPTDRKKAITAFNAASTYELLLFGGILIDSLI